MWGPLNSNDFYAEGAWRDEVFAVVYYNNFFFQFACEPPLNLFNAIAFTTVGLFCH